MSIVSLRQLITLRTDSKIEVNHFNKKDKIQQWIAKALLFAFFVHFFAFNSLVKQFSQDIYAD